MTDKNKTIEEKKEGEINTAQNTAHETGTEPPKSSQIIIEIVRASKGIDCFLGKDSAFPMNEIYIRGIFDKCRDQALSLLYQEQMKERQKQSNLVLPPNSMGAGLKQKFSKILGK